MGRLKQCIASFVASDDGATTVEYAVLLMLILMVCFAAIALVGERTNGLFEETRDSMPK